MKTWRHLKKPRHKKEPGGGSGAVPSHNILYRILYRNKPYIVPDHKAPYYTIPTGGAAIWGAVHWGVVWWGAVERTELSTDIPCRTMTYRTIPSQTWPHHTVPFIAPCSGTCRSNWTRGIQVESSVVRAPYGSALQCSAPHSTALIHTALDLSWSSVATPEPS